MSTPKKTAAKAPKKTAKKTAAKAPKKTKFYFCPDPATAASLVEKGVLVPATEEVRGAR